VNQFCILQVVVVAALVVGETVWPAARGGRSENRRPPQTAPQTTAGQTADHHRTRKI